MRRRPLVSVITPAHNAAAAIERCHESVVAQSFTDWEHIIIDDASVDGTAEIVARLAAEGNGQIKTLRLQRNSGAGRARNLGIEAAAGRFVAFLDADDFWLPEKLASQVAFMEQNRIRFSYGAYYIANGAAAEERKLFQPPDRLSYRQLLEGCPIGCLTAMYDSEALGKRFMPEVRRGQDWGLWLQLARICEEIAAYPGAHAVYSQNP
ncbi:glycosyltransferase family 2 protein, partial [Desulfurivibrio sp. D14AmB]|uniref:glycosyltransferase family 2 protein n=1 Tax=Desulfurivibrio sp. D14AmB TaxID=3374370 RepID=UPI00376F402B